MTCWASTFLEGKCEGRTDKAHLGFTKRRLRAEYQKQVINRKYGKPILNAILELKREEWVWDDRIWRPVCRAHHDRIDGPHFHLWKHQLPQSVLDFAREYELEYILDDLDAKRRP